MKRLVMQNLMSVVWGAGCENLAIESSIAISIAGLPFHRVGEGLRSALNWESML